MRNRGRVHKLERAKRKNTGFLCAVIDTEDVLTSPGWCTVNGRYMPLAQAEKLAQERRQEFVLLRLEYVDMGALE